MPMEAPKAHRSRKAARPETGSGGSRLRTRGARCRRPAWPRTAAEPRAEPQARRVPSRSRGQGETRDAQPDDHGARRATRSSRLSHLSRPSVLGGVAAPPTATRGRRGFRLPSSAVAAQAAGRARHDGRGHVSRVAKARACAISQNGGDHASGSPCSSSAAPGQLPQRPTSAQVRHRAWVCQRARAQLREVVFQPSAKVPSRRSKECARELAELQRAVGVHREAGDAGAAGVEGLVRRVRAAGPPPRARGRRGARRPPRPARSRLSASLRGELLLVVPVRPRSPPARSGASRG